MAGQGADGQSATASRDRLLALLEDVQLLLDYLQRLPESRLPFYFMREVSPRQPRNSDPVPPTRSLVYFLDRIAAIESAKGDGSGDGFTNPKAPTPKKTGGIETSRPDVNALESKPEAGVDTASSAGEQDTWDCAKVDDPGPRLNDTAFLFWARDFLSAIAYPATVDSIRVTRAFRTARSQRSRFYTWARARLGFNETASEKARKQAEDGRVTIHDRYGEKISSRVGLYFLLSIAVILFSIWATFLVFSGRVIIRENDTLRSARTDLINRMNLSYKDQHQLLQTSVQRPKLQTINDPPYYCMLFEPRLSRHSLRRHLAVVRRTEDRATSSYYAPNGREIVNNGKGTFSVLTHFGPNFLLPAQTQLCDEYRNLDKREYELKRIHVFWVNSVAPLSFMLIRLPSLPFQMFGTRAKAPSQEQFIDMDLITHRYGMEQMVDGLIGAVLPVAYALLGSLAAMLRRISRRAEAETLNAADYGQIRISLILGVVTGSVIGLFSDMFRTGDHSSGIPIATTALALLAGYASDRVFVMLDTLSERIFGQAPADRPTADTGKVVQGR